MDSVIACFAGSRFRQIHRFPSLELLVFLILFILSKAKQTLFLFLVPSAKVMKHLKCCSRSSIARKFTGNSDLDTVSFL
jgi:hypothetical protein